MSDVPHPRSLTGYLGQQLGGRWQVPLLIVSLGLLAVAVWRLRPVAVEPTFDDFFAKAVGLAEAELYTEASDYVRELLITPGWNAEQRRRLHGLMSEIIFGFEKNNVVHGRNNARLIIEHSSKSIAAGETFSPEMHRMRAIAFEWLQEPKHAIAEYEKALVGGIDDSWSIRRRIVELQRAIGAIAPDELHEVLNVFLTEPDVPADHRYWAADQKINLYAENEDYSAMEQFLEANRDVFSKESWQRQYDYLRALAWFYTGEITAAEARIRLLRDELDPGADLYGRAGWLLGKILQEQHQPEPALSVFEDVLEHGVPGPYHTAAMLGRAESLGEMQRYDKSVAAYNETIKLTTEDPYNAPIDLKDIRVSTTEWYQRLHDDGQLADAMSYLRIAARLAPPIETQLQMTYAGLLADLAFELGQQEMTAVDEAVDDGIRAQTELDRARRDGRDVARDEAEARDSSAQSEVEAAHASETEHGQRARSYFVEAGETYLRLARLAELEPDEATRAMWRAADSFDRAGVRDRTAEVLEEFVAEFPGNPRIPEALLRLGQVYQAGQQHDKAIEHYQANLVNFPRTRSAIASLVPLADCFIATGLLDKAETTLLRIIDHAPGDPLEPVEPVALIYKEALYRLAELYGEANEHERAIARYEEAIERYPDDPRADEAVFLLADAYRKNAAQLKRAIEDKRNIAFRDDLRLKYRRRLQRAYELFEEAIERYRDKSEAEMSDLEKLYVKLSHFYRGDAVYDLAFLTQIEDTQYFARAVEMYDRAAWLYQTDPMALSAYTQMINCYLRMGQTEEARKTLNRAMWALRNISDEQFSRYSPLEGREFWRNYLDWLARTPTFRVAEYEHQQAETEAEDQTSPVG